MLLACWSSKGGAGTTTVATALARSLSLTDAVDVVVVDLAGDVPDVLGLDEPSAAPRPGVADWLAAADDVGPDALWRVADDVGGGLVLVRRGSGPLAAGRAPLLAAALAADPRPVVVDCGVVGGVDCGCGAAASVVARAASPSLAVLRPTPSFVRTAISTPVRPTGLVLVRDGTEPLRTADVVAAVGVPARAEITLGGRMARLLADGVLWGRLPARVGRALRQVA